MPLVFKGTRAELAARLRGLTAALSGRGPDADGVADAVLLRGAVALLSQVQTAFIAKARGGTGSDGIKWPPLKRATVAGRRTSRAELKSLGIKGKRTRGLLTPAQDKRWRAIFASTLAKLRARGTGGAEALAAQTAWAVLKSEGAKTKLDVLGGRAVQILTDTGRLLASLSPGIEGDPPARRAGQILDVGPGKITVGTNVEYAERHHRGDPSKGLPARPLWPETLPDAWLAAVNMAIVRGLLKAVERAAAG